MTLELLQEGNRLNHAISELETQIQIVEAMLHDSDCLTISCPDIGSVTLSQEARLDVINTVLNDLGYRKEELEDRLRIL